jgi:hypothetical protein
VAKDRIMAPHINKNSTPCSILMLYFAYVITLLVEETNKYYQQYLDILDDGPSPLPDVTESEMFLFLVIIAQMRHGIWNSLSDLLVTIEQFLTPFCGSAMKCDWFFYIIRFLNFSNNEMVLTKITQTMTGYGQ